jgi:DNA modification methylase
MRSFIILPYQQSRTLPPVYQTHDVRFSETLVAAFLQEFTKPDDAVLDQFAGFGTTLVVAESMGRVAYGIEYAIGHVEYARTLLSEPERMIHGDALELPSYNLPAFDFSITSPPYMMRGDGENPLTAYSTPGSGYEAYLQGIQQVYAHVAALMKPNARVVIEASNLKGPGGVTTLAWDVAAAVGQVLRFDGEIVAGWIGHLEYGYDHTYCLVFSKQEQ